MDVMRCKIATSGFVAAICASWALWAHAQSVEITVQVAGLRSAQGRVLVALHADRSSFPSQWDRATASVSVAAATPAVTLAVKLPSPGRYALIVVHDEDGNGRMTKNLIGLPREGYTTGNNPAELEFPRFDRSLVDIRDARRIELQLRYP
jgi:uncharacterized protein (DUF2141 family)